MKPGSRIFYLGVGATILLLGGFGLLADEVVEGDTLNFDTVLLMMLRTPAIPPIRSDRLGWRRRRATSLLSEAFRC